MQLKKSSTEMCIRDSYCMCEPDEQAFQVEFAALFKFVTVQLYEVDGQQTTCDKVIQIEPQGGHIAAHIGRAFLESHEYAWFAR